MKYEKLQREEILVSTKVQQIKVDLYGANLQMFKELKTLYRIKIDAEVIKLLINNEYWSIRKELGWIQLKTE